jgi:hypothetical protein
VDQRIDGNYHALKHTSHIDFFTLKTNTMKQFFTLFFMTGLLVNGYSQRQSPSDMAKDLPRIPVNIGTVAFPNTGSRTNTTTGTNTEQDYQRLISQADAAYSQHQYDAAVAYYNMALDRKDQQYPKDQLLRIEAESARQQKDQAELTKQQAADLELKRKHTVHFSGLVMSDQYIPSAGLSKISQEDSYSNLLKPGKYDTIQPYLLKARTYTFDGVAVPPGTRLIVYKDLNCKGEVLLDVTGPAVVNNMLWQADSRYNNANSKNYTPELQSTYPQAVRTWSKSDMHEWGTGSMEIIILQ